MRSVVVAEFVPERRGNGGDAMMPEQHCIGGEPGVDVGVGGPRAAPPPVGRLDQAVTLKLVLVRLRPAATWAKTIAAEAVPLPSAS